MTFARWQQVAQILAGETMTDARLGALTTELEQPPEQPLDCDSAFMFTTRLAVSVGDQAVVLGQQTLHVDAATVRTNPDRPARLR